MLVLLAVMAAFVGSALIYNMSIHTVPAMSETQETDEKYPAVPILMYHSVCNNEKVNSDYRISPEMFESDMKYLFENGYTAIYVGDLVGYVYEGMPLPDKPVIITLDDGYLNNSTYVLPILEKYDMCATVSVVGEFIAEAEREKDPNPKYAYLTWQDIRTLEDSGRIEIGNHTNAMHEIGERRGCMKIVGESDDGYDKALSSDLTALQNSLTEKSGITPIVFTYPFGFVSEESLPIVKKLGFLAALTCYERINYIDGTRDQLYRLGRFNRAPGLSTEQFMKKVGI
ncbi:MAG: polysaccharide deacetylase family protein [Clostridia bacterium]|nr:polysaccharide deacetylase family protein [Clostridia bacterium]